MATPPPELCSLGQGWGESTLAWLLPLSKPTSFPTFWSATHSQNDLNSQPTSWSISRKTQHATVALVPALVPLSKDIIFENRNIKFYLPFINLQLSHLGSLHSKKKNPPTMQKTWVLFLGWEDPLEKGMETHSSILAWKIPWTEEPGRL